MMIPIVRINLFRLLAIWGMLCLGHSLHAQIDTTRQAVDSLANDSLKQAPVRSPSKGGAASPFDTLAGPQNDSLAIAAFVKRQKKANRPTLKERVDPYLPEIYDQSEKKRLRIPIPWRADIDMPLPIGLFNAPPRPPYIPRIAWQRSAMLPGLGQIYNKSYWKVPLFYAGYAGLGWWINYNHQEYLRHRRSFLCAEGVLDCDPDADLAGLDSEGIRSRRNKFRRDRDFAFLIIGGWHIIQIAEAYIHAHLREFDVSEDLSWQAVPVVDTRGGAGVGLSLRF